VSAQSRILCVAAHIVVDAVIDAFSLSATRIEYGAACVLGEVDDRVGPELPGAG